MDLEDSFESDFNAKLEDGSPYEVKAHRPKVLPSCALPAPSCSLLSGLCCDTCHYGCRLCAHW